MSSRVVVTADCVCDLPESVLKNYGIRTIPFYVSVGTARFQDFTEIDFETACEYMEADSGRVTSEPASAEDYKSFFKSCQEDGNTVLHICVSSGLSSAFQNAVAASDGMPQVHVFDSGLASHGMGLLVMEAARLANDGVQLTELTERLGKIKNNIQCSFLIKPSPRFGSSSRVNRLVSNLAEMFQIRSAVRVRKSDNRILGIYWGRRENYVRRYVRRMLRRVRSISDETLIISVFSSSNGLQEMVCREAVKRVAWKNVYVHNVSATIMCNAGLDSVGMAFYTK